MLRVAVRVALLSRSTIAPLGAPTLTTRSFFWGKGGGDDGKKGGGGGGGAPAGSGGDGNGGSGDGGGRRGKDGDKDVSAAENEVRRRPASRGDGRGEARARPAVRGRVPRAAAARDCSPTAQRLMIYRSGHEDIESWRIARAVAT
jgi:hypothetical protein